MPSAATTVIGKSASDIRAQTEAEIYPKIQGVVEDYLIGIESKCWSMVEVAMEARKLFGDGPEPEKQVRDLFRKAFAESHKTNKEGNLEKDPTYRSNVSLASKVVKIAFHYTDKQVERMRKDGKGFSAIYSELPKEPSKKQKKTASMKGFIEQLKKDVEEGIIDPAAISIPLDSTNRPLGAVPSAGEPPTTGWTSKKVKGRKTSDVFQGDDWRKETLAIIDEQFDRFLTMIDQAREKELTKEKCSKLMAHLTYELKKAS